MAYQKVVELLGENPAILLELCKKWFIDWKIDFKKLIDLFHQLHKDDVLGLLNGTHKIVKVTESAKKKVTEFMKKVTVKLDGLHVKQFDTKYLNISIVGSDFADFLNDVFSDHDSVSEQKVTFHWYRNVVKAHDDIIWPQIGQKIIDLSNYKDREEAKRRLNYLYFELRKQPKGEIGNLLTTNDYSNAIGVFKLKSGRIYSVSCTWESIANHWTIRAWPPWQHNAAGNQFLSCKSETK